MNVRSNVVVCVFLLSLINFSTCLSFFKLRILITPLVSSNSSYRSKGKIENEKGTVPPPQMLMSVTSWKMCLTNWLVFNADYTMLRVKQRSNKYQCYTLWFGPMGVLESSTLSRRASRRLSTSFKLDIWSLFSNWFVLTTTQQVKI